MVANELQTEVGPMRPHFPPAAVGVGKGWRPLCSIQPDSIFRQLYLLASALPNCELHPVVYQRT
jgi:hypothetical protein